MRKSALLLPFVVVLSIGATTTPATTPTPIPPVMDATAPADVRKLCSKQDFPAIAEADHVVIETAKTNAKVDVKDPALLKAIRTALKVADIPPTGGMTAYTVTFYRGDQKIRAIWVFDYGEWGLERVTASPTCGTSINLVPAIKDALVKSRQ